MKGPGRRLVLLGVLASFGCDGSDDVARAPAWLDPLPAVCRGEPAPAPVPGVSGPTAGFSRVLAKQMVQFPLGEASHVVLNGAIADTPAYLRSLTFVLGGPGAGELALGVERDGMQLTDGNAPEFSPNRVLRGRDWVVAQVSVASGDGPVTGHYLLRAQRPAGTPAETADLTLTMIGKMVPIPAEGTVAPRPRLLLAPLLAGGNPEPERLACALSVTQSLWARAGLDVLLTENRPLDEVSGEPLVLDPALGHRTPALGALLRLSTRAAAGSVALFIVPDVRLGGAESIWATSGGIPIAPFAGTTQSGIAASARLIDDDPVAAGRVLAHELGHALGLFHTTEAQVLASGQVVHDPLDGTPACPASADVDRDGRLDARECAAFDGGNLMFWQTPDDAVALTPEQAAVVLRSPLVR